MINRFKIDLILFGRIPPLIPQRKLPDYLGHSCFRNLNMDKRAQIPRPIHLPHGDFHRSDRILLSFLTDSGPTCHRSAFQTPQQNETSYICERPEQALPHQSDILLLSFLPVQSLCGCFHGTNTLCQPVDAFLYVPHVDVAALGPGSLYMPV